MFTLDLWMDRMNGDLGCLLLCCGVPEVKGFDAGLGAAGSPTSTCPAMMPSESLSGKLNGQIHLFASDRLKLEEYHKERPL